MCSVVGLERGGEFVVAEGITYEDVMGVRLGSFGGVGGGNDDLDLCCFVDGAVYGSLDFELLAADRYPGIVATRV